jgi:hypothetical protein
MLLGWALTETYNTCVDMRVRFEQELDEAYYEDTPPER